MDDLIEALTILRKYIGDIGYPTHCEHDVLYVMVEFEQISEEDQARLDDLGFFECEEHDCMQSFRFGSG